MTDLTDERQWVLVPREPTEEMHVAGLACRDRPGSGASVTAIYRAMLAASPVSIPQDGTSGVRVKALVWDGNRAETPVGIYYVSRIGADWTVERGHTHAGDFYALKTGRATDFDAALVEGKAVAQLDCETRILAALEPSP